MKNATNILVLQLWSYSYLFLLIFQFILLFVMQMKKIFSVRYDREKGNEKKKSMTSRHVSFYKFLETIACNSDQNGNS